MTPDQKRRRYWSDPLIQTRKRRRYERTAPVEELVADLAVVRALGDAAEGRRVLYRVLILLLFGSALALWVVPKRRARKLATSPPAS